MSAEAWALLAKALRSLTDEELGVVLDELMAPGAGRLLNLGQMWPPSSLPALFEPHPADSPPEPAVVGFLLRLPPDRHAALKTWCETNGYSMAVVVRGLVERFLDERAPRSTSGS